MLHFLRSKNRPFTFFCEKLKVVVRDYLEKMEYKKLRLIGLSKLEVACYEALYKIDDTTAANLAKHLSIKPTSVYRILNRLEERGFVSHIKTNLGPTHYYAEPLSRALEKYFAYQERAVAPLLHQQNIRRRQMKH